MRACHSQVDDAFLPVVDHSAGTFAECIDNLLLCHTADDSIFFDLSPITLIKNFFKFCYAYSIPHIIVVVENKSN